MSWFVPGLMQKWLRNRRKPIVCRQTSHQNSRSLPSLTHRLLTTMWNCTESSARKWLVSSRPTSCRLRRLKVAKLLSSSKWRTDLPWLGLSSPSSRTRRTNRSSKRLTLSSSQASRPQCDTCSKPQCSKNRNLCTCYCSWWSLRDSRNSARPLLW